MNAPARPKAPRKNPYASPFPPRIETRALTLPETGGLIAVVSDTHSQPHPDAIPRLRALAPHAILHGGDIGDLTVLDRLAEIAPVIAVRGNIDGHSRLLKKAGPSTVPDRGPSSRRASAGIPEGLSSLRNAEIGPRDGAGRREGVFQQPDMAAPPDVVDLTITRADSRLRVLLTHIAVRGPKLRAETRRLAATHHAELVVCGHSHVPLIARDGGVVLMNPGSIGPRRFGLPITFGLLEVTPAGVSLRHIDCETGRPWTPPPR